MDMVRNRGSKGIYRGGRDRNSSSNSKDSKYSESNRDGSSGNDKSGSDGKDSGNDGKDGSSDGKDSGVMFHINLTSEPLIMRQSSLQYAVVVNSVLLPLIALNCLPGCYTRMFNCSGILD
jgi:hypothetical protein